MKPSIPHASIDSYTHAAAIACFLHDLFRYPTRAQWCWLKSQPVKYSLDFLMDRYVPGLEHDESLPCQYSEYEEHYLATFEVGLPHPPCPLIESHWNKTDPIPKIRHENILFYKKFGLLPKEEAKESSDHLRFQLEFLSYITLLCANESQTGDAKDRLSQIEKARMDYLQRHLIRWVPIAVRRLAEIEVRPWMVLWLQALEGFLYTQAKSIERITTEHSE